MATVVLRCAVVRGFRWSLLLEGASTGAARHVREVGDDGTGWGGLQLWARRGRCEVSRRAPRRRRSAAGNKEMEASNDAQVLRGAKDTKWRSGGIPHWPGAVMYGVVVAALR